MAIFPGTPDLESRNCLGPGSHFGCQYLPIAKSNRNAVSSKDVVLVESFSTLCHTLKSDIRKRSIPDF
jgi:hypothetical protein